MNAVKFLVGPVYDPTTAREAVGWLKLADKGDGPDKGSAGVQALLYDAGGEAADARAAASIATDQLPEIHRRARLGILKIEAAKGKGPAADRTAADIAWDAVEWMNCEANKVGDKAADLDEAIARAAKLVKDMVLNGRPETDVFIKAANARIDLLLRINSPDGIREKQVEIQDAFQAAAVKTDGHVVLPGEGDVDYVCRMFLPSVGIDEDPATGSIHCTLAPYWAGRLGKDTLRAQQLSARGGHMQCTIGGDRVKIAGRARSYLHGTLEL
jgi:predicted PhzF superfamily epimerase YddE/YHI9